MPLVGGNWEQYHYRDPIIVIRRWWSTVETPADATSHIPLAPAYFHILLSLAGEPVHGYGVRQDVERRTNGTILLAAGTLYEALQRLKRDGLIQETDPPAERPDGASSRWRFYQVTPLGRQVLVLEVSRLEADVAAARARLPAT